MADPLLTVEELPTYWRPLTAAEATVAGTLLIVASAMVRSRFPDVDTRIAADTLDPTIVKYVVAEMVKSAVESGNRPVDAKSTSDTTGPFTFAVTYTAASRIALTDDLADMLVGELPATVGSARLGLPVYSTLDLCSPTYDGTDPNCAAYPPWLVS